MSPGGARESVVRLHREFYGPAWGFDGRFEEMVGRELGAILDRPANADDLFLLVEEDGAVLGSLVIDGHPPAGERGARLRFFVVAAAARGRGLGRRMLAQALAHCDARGFAAVSLWTFAGLDAAIHLYRSAGFVEAGARDAAPWGVPLREIRMVRERRSAA